MVIKERLMPGMEVMNMLSGKIGELMADRQNPKLLVRCPDTRIFVKTKTSSNRKWSYRYWDTENVELM